ncbi:MAG: AMP-binding protein [Planctomycetes bacterium]|nr:AMP-binding protein [Planctomycetota bacterium]
MKTAASEPRTLSQALAAWAARAPHAPACHDRTAEGWRPVAWRNLQRDSERAACAFRVHGVGAGACVAIQARGCSQWLAAEWAAYRCGAVVTGLDPFASPEQLAPVLKETRPVLALAESPAHARVLEELTKDFGTVVVTLDAQDLGSWRALLDGCATSGEGSAFDESAPDAPATRIYTSGTTGKPKGLVYTHAQVLLACRSIVNAYGAFSPRDVGLCWLPMAHLFQRMINFVTLECGASLYCADDPREVVARAREVEPTVFVGVPRFFEKFHAGVTEKLGALKGWRRRLVDAALAAGRARGQALRAGRALSLGERLRFAFWDRVALRRIRGVLGRRLRFAVCGSAPAPVWLLEFFHDLGLPVLEAYGVSENIVPTAANVPGAWRIGSVGKPFAENEVKLARDGELLVRSPGLCAAYADGRALPQTRDGFYRTGDLGRFDADGFLYLTGRKRELIKTAAGRRVEPARVEAAYRRCPLVEQIAIFGHGRAHLAALLTVPRKVLPQDGDAEKTARALAELRARLQAGFRECERDLAPYERIRDFAIEMEPFTPARGELTASLKLRRDAIAANRREALERLYAEPARPQASALPVPAGAAR